MLFLLLHQIYHTEGNKNFTKRNTGINEGMSMNTGVNTNADKRYTGMNAQKMLLSGIRYESTNSKMTQSDINSMRPSDSEMILFPHMNESFCSGFPEDKAYAFWFPNSDDNMRHNSETAADSSTGLSMVQILTLKEDSTGLSARLKYFSAPQKPQSIISTDRRPLKDAADTLLLLSFSADGSSVASLSSA